jgi:glycosyltransferase involved in cell wall biosynthesis
MKDALETRTQRGNEVEALVADALLVSVIVPVHNEVSTLAEVIARVKRVQVSKEILVVDDGSTDGTSALVCQLVHRLQIRAFLHNMNRGKGAAIRTAIIHAVGSIVVIQDADLEYDPAEIEQLIAPIVQGYADVVYGSRFQTGNSVTCSMPRRFANRFLTWLSNCFTGLRLTDMETCYKAFRREIATQLVLRENRFGIEPELTAKFARGGWRLVEVPISYVPRSYAAGKKIGIRDGVRAIWCILHYSRWD